MSFTQVCWPAADLAILGSDILTEDGQATGQSVSAMRMSCKAIGVISAWRENSPYLVELRHDVLHARLQSVESCTGVVEGVEGEAKDIDVRSGKCARDEDAAEKAADATRVPPIVNVDYGLRG